ncbi:MAG: TVP38/TMEM64 family protein [Desulfarculaceae bacterium]|nr:TVP38/TMEM64 family protein [Desulfarculaceae bacterium]MCF8071579.1 TVP38/TMEM64 family protein [Desulfarculaceae bacterium]MCF8102394.1 TVP38/TMEM64 family protein [Desulfarculaceae bacterium]MCF8114858.1 TVP38/TMEM64 family protein [Desulfarculaceae bacterium]
MGAGEQNQEPKGETAASKHLRRWLKWGLVALLFLGLAAVWRFTPLDNLLQESTLAAWAAKLKGTHLASLAVMLVYMAAGAVMVPLALLTGACGLIFGPWWGSAYALLGSMASALVLYGVGRAAGRAKVGKWSGGRLGRLSKHMADHSITTIILVRILPVAPFTVINLAAGATRVRPWPYILGTFLGVLPNTLAITVFADRLHRIWRQPHWGDVAVAVAVLAALALLIWLLRRVSRRRRQMSEASR